MTETTPRDQFTEAENVAVAPRGMTPEDLSRENTQSYINYARVALDAVIPGLGKYTPSFALKFLSRNWQEQDIRDLRESACLAYQRKTTTNSSS